MLTRTHPHIHTHGTQPQLSSAKVAKEKKKLQQANIGLLPFITPNSKSKWPLSFCLSICVYVSNAGDYARKPGELMRARERK